MNQIKSGLGPDDWDNWCEKVEESASRIRHLQVPNLGDVSVRAKEDQHPLWEDNPHFASRDFGLGTKGIFPSFEVPTTRDILHYSTWGFVVGRQDWVIITLVGQVRVIRHQSWSRHKALVQKVSVFPLAMEALCKVCSCPPHTLFDRFERALATGRQNPRLDPPTRSTL